MDYPFFGNVSEYLGCIFLTGELSQVTWITSHQLWRRRELWIRMVLSLRSGSSTSCLQQIIYKYIPLPSIIYWDQIQSHHNSKPGMAEDGCIWGLLVMLLLFLGIESFMAEVAYRYWVLQVTPLQPWLTQILHWGLELVVILVQSLVFLYICIYELSCGTWYKPALYHTPWICCYLDMTL